MYTPEDLLKAATAIRPALPELLGAEASSVDQRLADLLHRAGRGEPVEHEIAELLAAYEPTRHQMKVALCTKGEAIRYCGLPGAPAPPRPPKYVCSAEGCGYAWYRHQVGAIPDCPVHRFPLVLAKEP